MIDELINFKLYVPVFFSFNLNQIIILLILFQKIVFKILFYQTNNQNLKDFSVTPT